MADLPILRKIDISFDYLKSSEASEINRNLNTLYSTPIGSCGLYRDFGIDWTLVDCPIELAKQNLAIEIIEKTEKYEPRVKVEEVTYEQDVNGNLRPKVVIKDA